MIQADYDRIAPLVLRSSIEGRQLSASFRCPVSGDTFSATVGVPTSGVTREGATQPSTLRGVMGRFLANVLGGPSTDSDGGEEGGEITESQRRAALVAAFNKVAHRFVWDGGNNQWLSARAAVGVVPEFTRQLSEYPVAEGYDRTILARILVEIAAADGTLADEERAFLLGFIPADLGSLDDLMAMPRLSPLELRETTAGASRETLLMIAWAMALTDEELADEETQRLGELATGLGLAPSLAEEMRHYAEVFVVDQALDRAWKDGILSPELHSEVRDLATAMGLDQSAFTAIDQRHRRRNGFS